MEKSGADHFRSLAESFEEQLGSALLIHIPISTQVYLTLE
jgi:hypothetical protein